MNLLQGLCPPPPPPPASLQAQGRSGISLTALREPWRERFLLLSLSRWRSTSSSHSGVWVQPQQHWPSRGRRGWMLSRQENLHFPPWGFSSDIGRRFPEVSRVRAFRVFDGDLKKYCSCSEHEAPRKFTEKRFLCWELGRERGERGG